MPPVATPGSSTRRRLSPLPVLLAATLLAAPVPYEEGQVVTVQGQVTGPEGTPLEGIRVILEGTPQGMGFASAGKGRRNPVRVGVESGEKGGYALEWTWRPGHGRFQLLAGYSEPRHGSERFRVLASIDISEAMLRGSPVTVDLVVPEADEFIAWREFIARPRSPAQGRVYEQEGKPDTVRRTEGAGRESTSWWYFERGKVYWFLDGELEEVREFEPVVPF